MSHTFHECLQHFLILSLVSSFIWVKSFSHLIYKHRKNYWKLVFVTTFFVQIPSSCDIIISYSNHLNFIFNSRAILSQKRKEQFVHVCGERFDVETVNLCIKFCKFSENQKFFVFKLPLKWTLIEYVANEIVFKVEEFMKIDYIQ